MGLRMNAECFCRCSCLVFISTWLAWLRLGFVIHSLERQLDGWMDEFFLVRSDSLLFFFFSFPPSFSFSHTYTYRFVFILERFVYAVVCWISTPSPKYFCADGVAQESGCDVLPSLPMGRATHRRRRRRWRATPMDNQGETQSEGKAKRGEKCDGNQKEKRGGGGGRNKRRKKGNIKIHEGSGAVAAHAGTRRKNCYRPHADRLGRWTRGCLKEKKKNSGLHVRLLLTNLSSKRSLPSVSLHFSCPTRHAVQFSAIARLIDTLLMIVILFFYSFL